MMPQSNAQVKIAGNNIHFLNPTSQNAVLANRVGLNGVGQDAGSMADVQSAIERQSDEIAKFRTVMSGRGENKSMKTPA